MVEVDYALMFNLILFIALNPISCNASIIYIVHNITSREIENLHNQHYLDI